MKRGPWETLKQLCRVHNNTIVLIIFLILSFALFSSSHIITWEIYVPNSPDESQYLFFAKNLAETHKLFYINSLNENYSPQIFAPRQYIQIDEKTLPSKALGYILLLGASYFINEKLLLFVTPFMGAIGLLFYYKMISLVFNKKIGSVATGLLLIFPSYFFWSNTIFPNIPMLTFLVASFFFLLKIFKYPKEKINYIFFPILFALAIWMRYETLLLLMALIPVILLNHSKLNKKYLLLSIFILTFCMLPLSILYIIYYKSPSNYALHVLTDRSPQQEIAPPPISPFLPFRSIVLMISYGLSYLVLMSPLLTIFSILGLIHSITSRKRLGRIFFIIFSMTLLIIVSLVGGGLFSGWEYKKVIPASGYSRYYLPIYTFIVAYGGCGLVKFSQSKSIKKIFVISVILVYVISSISLTFLSPLGINIYANKERFLGYKYLSDRVVQDTPQNSVIFCKQADKYIFPHRNVAYFPAIPEEVRIKETTNLIKELVFDRIPVYFLQEDSYDKVKFYFNTFEDAGLKVELVDESIRLYQITRGG